ncbi:MAG TPA: hypothetical protein VN892_12745 [Solirubrobacteraceae bacterium]|jgi:hypothetical protein|nr:hypothetical protein [Solirubrobacteraceae bacterium]
MSTSRTTTPTPSDLLQELRAGGRTSGSYAEIEDALVEVMNRNTAALPPLVTARDVLVYARDHGLIAREGDKLVLHADRSK